MERKTSTMCTIENHIEDIYIKYTKYKNCNSKRSLKRYYEIKDNLSNQRKI